MSSAPFSQAELDGFTDRWNATSMLEHLGFHISFRAGERVIIELPSAGPQHRGGKGTEAINGAVMSAMFDFALGACAFLAPPLRANATVQLSIMFERGLRGNSARCEGVVERATRKLLFASATMYDARGDACARATGLVNLGEPVSFQAWQDALIGARA